MKKKKSLENYYINKLQKLIKTVFVKIVTYLKNFTVYSYTIVDKLVLYVIIKKV